MKFPTAKERRSMSDKRKIVKNSPLSIKTAAKRFVNNKVLPEILESEYDYVNVEMPFEAYRDLDGFTEECKKIIPKDYTVEHSDDGCGMYDTLFVSW